MHTLEVLDRIDPNGPRSLEEMVRRAKERGIRNREREASVRPVVIRRPLPALPAPTPSYDMASISRQMCEAHKVLDGQFGLTIEQVQRTVCQYYGIRLEDMRGPRRQLHLVRPRQVAMYLSRELMTSKSLLQIAKVFGDRDHTTILSGVRKITSLLYNGDDILADEIAEMRSALGA